MSTNTRSPATIITIHLTGQTEFTIPFEYLARKFVAVTLVGTRRVPLVLNTDYRYVSSSVISLAQMPAAEFTKLELRRVTSASDRLVDFNDGSTLRAHDLNVSTVQSIHIAQEARDSIAEDGMGIDDDGNLDARGRRITNVADAEAGSDALTLGQLIGMENNAYTSAIRAEESAIRAEWAANDAYNAVSYSLGQVDIRNFTDLKAAIEALPADGGTVFIPVGRFYAGNWDYNVNYMKKPNVSLVGRKCPTFNDNATELVGGSVIEGRFNVFADNFSVENLGFDLGNNVVARRFGGASTETNDYPFNGGTWDSFAFASPGGAYSGRPMRGFRAVNVVTLAKKPQTVGHSFLAEGFNGGHIDNVVGIYSMHPVVIKASGVTVGSITGAMGSSNPLILKSDGYAGGGNIQIANAQALHVLPNCNPHAEPVTPPLGLRIDAATASFGGPIQIANLKVTAGSTAVGLTGPNNATDIILGNVIIEGYNSGIKKAVDVSAQGAKRRFNIGNLIVNNVADGVACAQSDSGGEPTLSIGTATFTNLTGWALAATDHAEISIDNLMMKNVDIAYTHAGNGKIRVGTATMHQVSKLFHDMPTAESILTGGWRSFGANNEPFMVDLNDYRVRVRGLVTGGSAGNLGTVPAYLRPEGSVRMVGYKSGAEPFALLGISNTGMLTVDDAQGDFTGKYVSMSELSWAN